MAFKIELSEQAANDLDEIIRYINDELYNPQAANRLYKAVFKRIDLLRDNPYMYPLYHDEKLRSKGYRYVAIGNYIMFYIVKEEAYASIVTVVRVLYGPRDIPAVFDEE